jgi:tetratricopeptide (TPR) repeat protein
MSAEMKTVPTTRTFVVSLFIVFVGLGFAINAAGQRGLGGFTDVRALQEKILTAERGTPDQAVAAMREAVEQFKTNPTAWYYYGLALKRSGDLAGARDAFRKSFKFDPNFVQARLRLAQTLLLANQPGEAEKEARRALDTDAKPGDKHYVFGEVYLFCGDAAKALTEAQASIQTNSSFAPALLLKHKATLLTLARSNDWKPEKLEQQRQLLKDAIESLEKYFALAQPKANYGFLSDQLETLRFYAKAAEEDPQAPGRQVFFPSEVTIKAHIFSKPPPQYTEDARFAHMQGTVMMAAVLSADGNIEHILALQTLGFGLTGMSIEAAKQIKFTPATKDGLPVATWMDYQLPPGCSLNTTSIYIDWALR